MPGADPTHDTWSLHVQTPLAQRKALGRACRTGGQASARHTGHFAIQMSTRQDRSINMTCKKHAEMISVALRQISVFQTSRERR